MAQAPFKPYIASPFSVVTNSSGKKRLILDLSILNLFVRKYKVKFEDWNLVAEYFPENCYMLKFDLKSGYFHADIPPSQMFMLIWLLLLFCGTVWIKFRPLHFHQMFETYGQVLAIALCTHYIVLVWWHRYSPSQSGYLRDCHLSQNLLKTLASVIMRPSLFYSHHKVWNGWVLSGILSPHIPAKGSTTVCMYCRE